MEAKVLEKNKVIALRKKGFTYSQILKLVPVSKSSISLWLMDLPLSEQEKKLLRKTKNEDMSRWRLRAASSLRKAKESRNNELFLVSKTEFNEYIKDPFFQVGILLYWAEGSKRSTNFGFINSDPEMVRVMLAWVYKFLQAQDDLKMRVYTHKAFSDERHDIFWAKETSIPVEKFAKTIFKTQSGLAIKKRPNYKGCVRIEMGKVIYLRKIMFWQHLLIEYYKKQGYSV